jgi:peroxiredoxin Q/BCP
MLITTGIQAPDFTLQDQEGKSHSLSSYLGKWVLLYFYPKDDTPGCTTEACTIRDSFFEFKENNIVVLGVSADSVRSHDKFAKKYSLPFTILSDEQKKVVEQYGVYGKKKFLGKTFLGIKRMSFLIDPDGKVAKVYEKVKPRIHASEVLQDIITLR